MVICINVISLFGFDWSEICYHGFGKNLICFDSIQFFPIQSFSGLCLAVGARFLLTLVAEAYSTQANESEVDSARVRIHLADRWVHKKSTTDQFLAETDLHLDIGKIFRPADQPT